MVGFVGIVGDDGRLATHKDYTERGVVTFMWSSFSKECPHVTHSFLRDKHLALPLTRSLAMFLIQTTGNQSPKS